MFGVVSDKIFLIHKGNTLVVNIKFHKFVSASTSVINFDVKKSFIEIHGFFKILDNKVNTA